MARQTLNLRTFALIFFGFLLLAVLLGYRAFVINNCLAYPWWHQMGNDADGIFVTQSLVLLNNGDLTLAHHPAGTLYGIFGSFYRLLGTFVKPYAPLLHLGNVPNVASAFSALDLAMHAARVLSFGIYLLFLLIFWRLAFCITKSHPVSFFLTAYYALTQPMIELLNIIRPEILSLGFCLLMFIFVVQLTRSTSGVVWEGFSGIAAGVMAGLAILAKIQVLPFVVFVLAVHLFLFPAAAKKRESRQSSVLVIVIAAINLIVMPWNWLKRPAYLTDAVLKSFSPGGDYARVYGAAPQTLAPFAILILLILTLLSVTAFWKRKSCPGFAGRMLRLNLFVTGIILAVYLVFALIGMHPARYAANSNHLIYATITNLFYGGFVLRPNIVNLETLRRVAGLHAYYSPFLQISILWFVGLAVLGTLLRIFFKAGEDRRVYYSVLLFFCAGFFMDVISTLRMDCPIKSNYAIFSLACYILGLGAWLAVEIRRSAWRWGPFNLRIVLCALITLHIGGRTLDFFRLEHASGITDQTPREEMLNTLTHVRPFWHIVSQGKL